MKKYCCGFMFNSQKTKICLIEKNRPEWQKGKLNGVGGHIEEGETPLQAMIREFYEETGVRTSSVSWDHVCTLHFPCAEVEFFTGSNSFFIERAQSMTDEIVSIVDVKNTTKMIENLPALIELSIRRMVDIEGFSPRKIYHQNEVQD